MGLSDRTVQKLKAETEETGGKVYEEDDDISDEEITHFPEDSDPATLAGDPVEEDSPVDWDIDANRPVGEVPEGGQA